MQQSRISHRIKHWLTNPSCYPTQLHLRDLHCTREKSDSIISTNCCCEVPYQRPGLGLPHPRPGTLDQLARQKNAEVAAEQRTRRRRGDTWRPRRGQQLRGPRALGLNTGGGARPGAGWQTLDGRQVYSSFRCIQHFAINECVLILNCTRFRQEFRMT